MTSKPVLTIDGARFHDLAGFMDEFARVLEPDVYWGRHLDAFNDVLRGGFGTPEGGFILRWGNSERSRRTLGFPETVRWLEARAGAWRSTRPMRSCRIRRGVGSTAC